VAAIDAREPQLADVSLDVVALVRAELVQDDGGAALWTVLCLSPVRLEAVAHAARTFRRSLLFE
jgi:hypothetical protein